MIILKIFLFSEGKDDKKWDIYFILNIIGF